MSVNATHSAGAGIIEQVGEQVGEQVRELAGLDSADATVDKPFNDMSDLELLLHLAEFVGSGVVNTMINGALIETTQEQTELAMALGMDDDALADSNNANDPRVAAAKQRKLAGKAQDALEEVAVRDKEHQAKWDADMHDVGGTKYTGAQLHESFLWLTNPEHEKEFERELMRRYQISEDEAKKRRTNLEEYLKLQEKLRSGEKLTKDEEVTLKKLEPVVAPDLKVQKEMEAKGMRVSSNEYKESAAIDSVAADQETSVRAWAGAFEDGQANNVKNSVVTSHGSAAPAGYETGIDLSSTYNIRASGKEIDKPHIPVQQVAATVALNSDFGV